MSELKALRFSNALFVFSGSRINGARHHADVKVRRAVRTHWKVTWGCS